MIKALKVLFWTIALLFVLFYTIGFLYLNVSPNFFKWLNLIALSCLGLYSIAKVVQWEIESKE